MSHLLPLYDRIIVRPIAKASTSAGGIALYHRREEEKGHGTVVAVGPGRVLGDGERHAPSVQPGDHVIFQEGAGKALRHEGCDYLSIEDADLHAVVTP